MVGIIQVMDVHAEQNPITGSNDMMPSGLNKMHLAGEDIYYMVVGIKAPVCIEVLTRKVAD